jgi:putative chitinase
MMSILTLGRRGPEVAALQDALRARGFNPGNARGTFDDATEAAVLAFQRSAGLLADGIVGNRTATALGLTTVPDVVSVIPGVTVEVVSPMFPDTPVQNIRTNLPTVLQALIAPQLTQKGMVLVALATIRAETESFLPISEFRSKFNTSPDGQSFDLYDNRSDLGNQGPPDGANFRGRGFIQLTGRTNYQIHGRAIGLSDRLLTEPDLANDPQIAAQLLASFLKSKELQLKEALLHNDLAGARKLVNGGRHGLDRFTDAFQKGNRLIAEPLLV